MKTVRIYQTGGPDVLNYEDAPEPSPAPGHALVEIKSIGVNYTDVSSRKGTNPPDAFPWTPGREAAGVVTAIGAGVSEVSVGDRVAYAMHTGTYSQVHSVPSWLLVRIPDGMDYNTAAATMLQGMTAHFLVYGIAHLKEGDRMLKNIGVYVHTTVSTEEKADLAKGAGADHTIIYTKQDFEEEIRKDSNGQGLKMVMDAVGATTFDQGMRLLGRRGYMALYGAAGGPVGQRATDVLNWVQSGEVKLYVGLELPLSDAQEAHRKLEGRETTGKILLTP
ncbi:Quinone oxidoreductase [Geodia barretti]|uniref:Quinone oxidoreductase n=1 Tax=Geodia barretti TaxID=519541 RepID=A0AA35X0S8_GEOBA|nr:Quinone oxidoreductase [Geodia barretti]